MEPRPDNLERIASLVREARFAVALTGAGISTASGIPDFRSPGTGLWQRVDPTQVASIDAFRRDAVTFWSHYTGRLGGLAGARPNPAHDALARLEATGYLRAVITQNVDRLHHRAGSRAVTEVHGSYAHIDCLDCGSVYRYEELASRLDEARGVPSCACGAPLKPGVVLFGESLPEDELAQAVAWAESADLMLLVGSSLRVWPVAGLPQLTHQLGGRLVVLNREATPYDHLATVVERGPLEEVLPRLAELVTSGAVPATSAEPQS